MKHRFADLGQDHPLPEAIVLRHQQSTGLRQPLDDQ